MSIPRLAPVALAAMMFVMAPAAYAGPAASAAQAGAASVVAHDAKSAVTKVGRRWHRGGWRKGVGIGLGAAIVGGIIANEIYRPRAGYYYDDYEYDGPYYAPSGYRSDARELCARNFRSFEWDTGLYTTYSGYKRLCPYLR